MNINRTTKTPLNNSSTKNVFHYLGPALITAALVLGPGSLTLASTIGAVYGYQLVWLFVVAVIFMMVFTEMSTRIGLASNKTFMEILQNKWGKWGAIVSGLGAFLVSASFQAGNAIAVGVVGSTLIGLSPAFWIMLFTILSALLLFRKNFYKILEKLTLALVMLMLLSFVITLLLTTPSIPSIVQGFVPTVPDGSLGLIIGYTATCFSIVAATYQSYLVKEKGWGKDLVNQASKESYLGIFLLGLLSALVMIAAAAVLLPQGISIDSIGDMGLALEPLYGSWATVIFMLGLFGAAFSSFMGNATVGGALFSDGLGFGSKLSNFKVKIAIIAVMVFGSIIGIIFGGSPVNMIIFAQGVTIIVVPLLAIALLVVANDKKIMGKLTNSFVKNIIGVAGLIVLILLAINNINNIFFS